MRQGVEYRCPAALAATLGVSRSAVYQSLHRYGDAEHCAIRKGIKPGTRLGNHRKPIKVGPHQWPSISAMALDLGVSRRVLGYQLKTQPSVVLETVMRVKG
jgi:DNA-binding phage protein